MKAIGLIFGLVVGTTISQSSMYNIELKKRISETKKQSFQVGEKLKYRVSYGIMDAGEATLEIKKSENKINGRNAIHVVGVGKTIGVFSWFFKVHDVYESHINQETGYPISFKRRVNEGGYKISQDYTFNHKNKKVKDQNGKEYSITKGIQDMISAFYYARTFDLKTVRVGDTISYNCFMDNKIWPLKIKYEGTEEIKIRKGKFKCHKFSPVVQKGVYFKSEKDVNIWITDDENKIPVLIKAKIKVGTIRMHLVKWENLKHKLAKL